MTGVEFNGRIGNQLFQFCFFLYLKSRPRSTFLFFTNPNHARLTQYFDLGPYYNILAGSRIFSLVTRVLIRIVEFDSVYIQNIQLPREVNPSGNTIYRGFFQTDWYLKKIPGKFNLKIRKKYKDDFLRLYGDLFANEKVIAVHIRRTDYLNYGKRDISIPIEFFKARLAAINDLSRYRVFFLSDDIEYVKSAFGPKENFIFSDNNEIIDFQIIMNADIAIISNSSFSWWAAYLSEKDNQVFAPRNWLGFKLGKEHPKGIMTSRFNWCDIPT